MKYLFDATSELLRKALFVNTPLIFHFNLYMHFDREGSLSCHSFSDLGLSHPKTFILTRIARQSRDTEALFTESNDEEKN